MAKFSQNADYKEFKKDSKKEDSKKYSENKKSFKNDKNYREANKKRGTNFSAASKALVIENHPKFPDIYIGRGKEDVLLTKNMVPGSSVYNEKRMVLEKDGEKTEYRFWNCFRSKLAAGIVCGLEKMNIQKGTSVLYLGASSGTTLSHVSDIVGPDTLVYAVEFSPRSGRDLVNLATKRTNIVPIIADARTPSKYRMIVPMVDVIFSDVSQADQSRIVLENAAYFLKDGGQFLMSVKASCVDSSVPATTVFANEVNWLKNHEFKPQEQVTLEPYEKNHAMIVGIYKPKNKNIE